MAASSEDKDVKGLEVAASFSSEFEAASSPSDTDYSAWRGWPGFFTIEEALLNLDTYSKLIKSNISDLSAKKNSLEQLIAQLEKFGRLVGDALTNLQKTIEKLANLEFAQKLAEKLKVRLQRLDRKLVYPSSFYLKMVLNAGNAGLNFPDRALSKEEMYEFCGVKECVFFIEEFGRRYLGLEDSSNKPNVYLCDQVFSQWLPMDRSQAGADFPNFPFNPGRGDGVAYLLSWHLRTSFPSPLSDPTILFSDPIIHTVWASISLHNFLHDHNKKLNIDDEIKDIIEKMPKNFDTPKGLLLCMLTELKNKREGEFLGRFKHDKSIAILKEAIDILKRGVAGDRSAIPALIERFFAQKSLGDFCIAFANLVYIRRWGFFSDDVVTDKGFLKIVLKHTFVESSRLELLTQEESNYFQKYMKLNERLFDSEYVHAHESLPEASAPSKDTVEGVDLIYPPMSVYAIPSPPATAPEAKFSPLPLYTVESVSEPLPVSSSVFAAELFVAVGGAGQATSLPVASAPSPVVPAPAVAAVVSEAPINPGIDWSMMGGRLSWMSHFHPVPQLNPVSSPDDAARTTAFLADLERVTASIPRSDAVRRSATREAVPG